MTYDRKDRHYRRAKASGYRARSAYKLLELDHRFRLLRPGDGVIDLGAWPGAWLQVAVERVGPRGRVAGLDVVEPEPIAHVEIVVGDVRDAAAIARVRERLGRQADVVLSDVAPKLTGIRATDDTRTEELATAVLDALPVLLVSGGRAVLKLFTGPSQAGLVRRMRGSFRDLRTTRPDASRRGSAELYAIGLGYQPTCG